MSSTFPYFFNSPVFVGAFASGWMDQLIACPERTVRCIHHAKRQLVEKTRSSCEHDVRDHKILDADLVRSIDVVRNPTRSGGDQGE